MSDPTYEIQLRDRVAVAAIGPIIPDQTFADTATVAWRTADAFMRERARRLAAKQEPAPSAERAGEETQ